MEEFAFCVAKGFGAAPDEGAAAAAAKGLFIVAPLIVESCPPKIPPLLDEAVPKELVALFEEPKAEEPAGCWMGLLGNVAGAPNTGCCED